MAILGFFEIGVFVEISTFYRNALRLKIGALGEI